MSPSSSWFRCYRTPEVFDIFRRHRPSFFLLHVIAAQAQWSDAPNIKGLAPGEACLGDYGSYGMTEREYRTAKRNLEKWGLATFKATTLGTIATLCNERVFGVLPLPNDGRNDGPPTDGRRTPDGQATTSYKDIRKEGNNSSTKNQEREPGKPRPLTTADRMGIEKQVETLKVEIQKLISLRLHQQQLNHKSVLANKQNSLAKFQRRLAEGAEAIAG